MIRFLFLNVSSPFVLGVYDGNILIKKLEKDGRASDVLPLMIDEALQEFAPDEIYYTNGPGNHMSLKIAYVCLKALSIVKKIPFYGVSPFVFNDSSPIRAFKNSYFVSEAGKITVKVFEEAATVLPLVLLESLEFGEIKGSSEPLFLLPAV